MDEHLQARFTKYVNRENPLGPADAYLIKDTEVAAHLFDPHNRSFNGLLRKDISVVIGRRGSGKTALLNSYLYKPYFSKGDITSVNNSSSDIDDYELVIPIMGHRLFEHMQTIVAIPGGAVRPIESIVERWSDLVVDYVLATIHERKAGEDDKHIKIIEGYIASPDAKRKVEAYNLVWGHNIVDSVKDFLIKRKKRKLVFPSKEDALKACDAYLDARKSRALIIFDSMDEYEVGNPIIDRTVGALLRFVGQFNTEFDRIKIKLGLPSEIFPEIQRASANPLKDFVNFDQVRWTSVELAQIAAYRYRLFLRIFDDYGYRQVASIDLNHREGARRFWDKFLPEKQTNRYGHGENAMTYMLRHTQLLPRQLFGILQKVILTSHQKTGGYRLLTTEAIVESIVNMDPLIAGEIIQSFKHVYPYAETLSKAIFGNYPTVFSYDQLENRWRRIGRAIMREKDPSFELVNFTEMLLRMGVLGVVESESELYVQSKFAYNMLMPFSVGDSLTYAIHPIFSRYFACSANAQKKAVLPHGAALDAPVTS